MVTIELSSIQFHVSEFMHACRFELDYGAAAPVEIDIPVPITAGNIVAVHQYGHDALVTILEQALEEGRRLAREASLPATG